MSIASIITRGFGTFSTAFLVVTRGYSIAELIAADIPSNRILYRPAENRLLMRPGEDRTLYRPREDRNK